MQRIPAINQATAEGRARELLDRIQEKNGKVHNLFLTLAHSPAALETLMTMSATLDQGVLTRRQREQIAISVAQLNGCEYCLSAHMVLGKMATLSPEELEAARRGESADPRTAALLGLTRAIVEQRGQLTDEQLAQARQAGLSDAELTEVVAHVAHNIFTNYFNMIARTDLDWPRTAL